MGHGQMVPTHLSDYARRTHVNHAGSLVVNMGSSCPSCLLASSWKTAGFSNCLSGPTCYNNELFIHLPSSKDMGPECSS